MDRGGAVRRPAPNKRSLASAWSRMQFAPTITSVHEMRPRQSPDLGVGVNVALQFRTRPMGVGFVIGPEYSIGW
jgi:hypothetical protein